MSKNNVAFLEGRLFLNRLELFESFLNCSDWLCPPKRLLLSWTCKQAINVLSFLLKKFFSNYQIQGNSKNQFYFGKQLEFLPTFLHLCIDERSFQMLGRILHCKRTLLFVGLLHQNTRCWHVVVYPIFRKTGLKSFHNLAYLRCVMIKGIRLAANRTRLGENGPEYLIYLEINP